MALREFGEREQIKLGVGEHRSDLRMGAVEHRGHLGELLGDVLRGGLSKDAASDTEPND